MDGRFEPEMHQLLLFKSLPNKFFIFQQIVGNMGQNETVHGALIANLTILCTVVFWENKLLECDSLAYTFFLITKVTPRQQLLQSSYWLTYHACNPSVTHVDTV
mgnify:CR=1 FL=1